MPIKPILCAILASVLLTACSTAYYGAMEQFGLHKRDILVSRIETASSSQEDAKQQFASALAQFKSVVNFDGGDLEALYNQMEAEYEASESKAQAVHERIESVEEVAADLFREWETEIGEISSASLRSQSRRQLQETQTQYAQLIAAMRRAESRIDPVLTTFKDQTLFLKHNLNARAIASLSTELTDIETNVDQLVHEMEAAIAEAAEFINQMRSS